MLIFIVKMRSYPEQNRVHSYSKWEEFHVSSGAVLWIICFRASPKALVEDCPAQCITEQDYPLPPLWHGEAATCSSLYFAFLSSILTFSACSVSPMMQNFQRIGSTLSGITPNFQCNSAGKQKLRMLDNLYRCPLNTEPQWCLCASLAVYCLGVPPFSPAMELSLLS